MLVKPDISRVKHGWISVFVPVVICCLTLSLATRFCAPLTSSTHVAKSIERRTVEPKRQHLSKNAIERSATIAATAFLQPISMELRVVATEPFLPNHISDQSLYNRPPPVAILL